MQQQQEIIRRSPLFALNNNYANKKTTLDQINNNSVIKDVVPVVSAVYVIVGSGLACYLVSSLGINCSPETSLMAGLIGFISMFVMELRRTLNAASLSS